MGFRGVIVVLCVGGWVVCFVVVVVVVVVVVFVVVVLVFCLFCSVFVCFVLFLFLFVVVVVVVRVFCFMREKNCTGKLSQIGYFPRFHFTFHSSYLCTRKSPYALHPVSEKFPERCL